MLTRRMCGPAAVVFFLFSISWEDDGELGEASFLSVMRQSRAAFDGRRAAVPLLRAVPCQRLGGGRGARLSEVRARDVACRVCHGYGIESRRFASCAFDVSV